MRPFAVVAALVVGLCISSVAAERDAQSVVNELRLKQLTKNVGLTEEQQKKVKALYDDEAKVSAKISSDESLSFGDRTAKKQALIKETNEKIKPILTAEQKAKFEAVLAKTAGRKKPAAAPAGEPAKTPAAP